MRTVQTDVYSFDELDETAKENARTWYRNATAGDNDFHEPVYEEAREIAKLLGIEIDDISFSGFWSQGDGASFEGSYKYRKGSVKDVKAYAPKDAELHRIAAGLAAIQKKWFYQLHAVIGRNETRYSHEYTMAVDVYQDDNDTYAPDEVAKEVTELLRDFARWIYRQLEAAYEYTQSDEYVDEAILANDYEFLASGDKF